MGLHSSVFVVDAKMPTKHRQDEKSACIYHQRDGSAMYGRTCLPFLPVLRKPGTSVFFRHHSISLAYNSSHASGGIVTAIRTCAFGSRSSLIVVLRPAAARPASVAASADAAAAGSSIAAAARDACGCLRGRNGSETGMKEPLLSCKAHDDGDHDRSGRGGGAAACINLRGDEGAPERTYHLR